VAVDRARPIVGEPVLGVAGRNGSPDMAFHDNRWSAEGDGMEGAAIRWFWKEQYLVVELKVVLAGLDGDRMMWSTKRCFRVASEWPARCFGRRLATCGFGVVIGPACGEYELARGGGDVAHQQLRGGGGERSRDGDECGAEARGRARSEMRRGKRLLASTMATTRDKVSS
jgi:hypothetical protein